MYLVKKNLGNPNPSSIFLFDFSKITFIIIIIIFIKMAFLLNMYVNIYKVKVIYVHNRLFLKKKHEKVFNLQNLDYLIFLNKIFLII